MRKRQVKSKRVLRLALSLTMIAAIIAVSACSKKPANETAKRVEGVQETVALSFRLKWLIYSSFASHFVAAERGFFKEEGLDVKINPGGPGMDPIRLVATGADDVGLAGHEQILIAREKGLPVVAIAEDYVRSGVGFFSLKGSGIDGPEDFIGHKVGILPGTDKHTVYEALMAKLDIDRSKIEEVPVGFNLSLLLNGTVEVIPGFVTNQPFVAEEKGKPVNIVDPYEYGVRPGGNVYFTSEETLRTKRSELKGFLRSALRGVVEAQKMGDEEVVDIVLEYNSQLDRDAEVKIWRSTKEILLEKDPSKVGYLIADKWKHTAEISKQYGLIKEIPALERCFTNELVEEIHKEGFPTKN